MLAFCRFHKTLHRFFLDNLDKGFFYFLLSFFLAPFWNISFCFVYVFVSLYVDSFCLCAVSVFLRIFIAKDQILACKMFEIKSDRWHGIFFVVEIFLIQFFSLFNCIKVSFFGNFLSFCKNLIIFHLNFSFIGSDFYL